MKSREMIEALRNLPEVERCTNVNELLDLAQEAQLTISKDEAQEIFSTLTVNQVKLQDAQLAGVTGGTSTETEYCTSPTYKAICNRCPNFVKKPKGGDGSTLGYCNMFQKYLP